MVKETHSKNSIGEMNVHKVTYYKEYEWEDNYDESGNPFIPQDRDNGYEAHKANTNMSELIYYLEEMYQLGLLDEIETDIYERYMWGDRITSSDRMYVYEKAYEYFFEKF